MYAPETLMPAVRELTAAYTAPAMIRRFWMSWTDLHRTYIGRPTPLTLAANLTKQWGGARGLPQARRPGAHRRAQDQQRHRPGTPGQAHGQARVIAETGAGQHGVASATACALLGLDCIVYMGEVDIRPPVAERVPDEVARRGGARGQLLAPGRSKMP